MRQQLEQQATTREHVRAQHRRLTAYEKYLEDVVEASDEVQEVTELLARHGTLAASNKDLLEVVEMGNRAIEATRTALLQYTKEKEDELLVATSAIAGVQKAGEQMRGDNAKLEGSRAKREQTRNEKSRIVGEAKMAIANLHTRCRGGSRSMAAKRMAAPPAETTDLNPVLEFIGQRVADCRSMLL